MRKLHAHGTRHGAMSTAFEAGEQKEEEAEARFGRKGVTRRRALASSLLMTSSLACAESAKADDVDSIAELAKKAYAEKRLDDADMYLTNIINIVERSGADPTATCVWYERRGQVYVDRKRFNDALVDFAVAEKRAPENYVSLGLLANRGLAYEGLSQWQEAEREYSRALSVAENLGFSAPYLLNSRGNVYGSLGQYAAAADDFDAASRVFQTERNLAGAIYASSNGALARIEIGDEVRGERELRTVARRAAGSIDARAALAALYYSQGKVDEAEASWNFACESINSGILEGSNVALDGCAQYRDVDWLSRIRRWPPSMVRRMDDFLNLRSVEVSTQ